MYVHVCAHTYVCECACIHACVDTCGVQMYVHVCCLTSCGMGWVSGSTETAEVVGEALVIPRCKST